MSAPRNRSGQVHDIWAAHAVRDGVGGFERCPFKGRVIVLGEPNVQRLVTALRGLGDQVGHYRCAHVDSLWGVHYHVTDVTGTTVTQRKRWRRKAGVQWVKRRPGRHA